MTASISWYILITFLGWLTFPLSYRLFPALADRGYTLSRAFGLILWGFVFWLFATLGIAQNDIGGLLLGLIVLGGLSAWAYRSNHELRAAQLTGWLKENIKLILATEILFLLAFAFLAFFRSANPDILGTEKPMELMFLNGILNSPVFPPRDPWLAGYSISYYYFGYVMTAMLAKFTGVPATAAFNLMLALVYGLSAVGAYGILYNLLTTGNRKSSTALGLSFLGPVFLLLISNAAGFLEVLHARGLFWREGNNFWTWLDIPELRSAPPQVPQWAPDRFWWWWRASRVVQDYDLNGTFREAIDEFPAFSFLLGDLHPHVLAIPFFLLAIAFALNLFLGGFHGRVNLYFGELHLSKTGFILAAFLLGGMAFLNTWDILPVAAVIVFSYGLGRVREAGWGWGRLEDVLLFGIPLMVSAYVMYLPFFIGFDSQAGGLIPNFMYITRGAQLWVMWGTLFVPVFAFLIHLARTKFPADWRAGFGFGLGLVLALTAVMLAMGVMGYRLRPEMVQPILSAQGRDAATFLADSFARRLSHIGSLLSLLALLIPALAFIFHLNRTSEQIIEKDESEDGHALPSIFVLLLVVPGTLLILGPDFLYLSDNFGYRINTIFKFYYQAWILLSLAAAYGTSLLLQRLRGVSNMLFSLLFVLVLIVGLTYPVLAYPDKAGNFQPSAGFTLDDFDRVLRENPDEAAAMLWLMSAPDGVVAEATGDPYSSYGRFSVYTGQPTILGWGNHEGQWRGSDMDGILLQRRQDIEVLFTTSDVQTALAILERYNVRYVIVGNLERTSYRTNEEKFRNFLTPVFQQGNVVIFEVP